MTNLFALWRIQVRLQNSCEGAVPLRERRTPRWWGDGCARTQRRRHCFGGPDEGKIDVARWKRRWHFHHQEEEKEKPTTNTSFICYGAILVPFIHRN